MRFFPRKRQTTLRRPSGSDGGRTRAQGQTSPQWQGSTPRSPRKK